LDNTAVSEHVIRVVPDTTRIDPGYLCVLLDSEIGSTLLRPGIHGSVVDEITPEYIRSLKIPLLSMKQQRRIGDFVASSDRHLTEAFANVTLAREALLEELKPIRLTMPVSEL